MAHEYKVIKIDELTRVSDIGGVKQVYRYTVKTRGGTVFTVELDDPSPTSDKVAPILAGRATEFDRILAL